MDETMNDEWVLCRSDMNHCRQAAFVSRQSQVVATAGCAKDEPAVRFDRILTCDKIALMCRISTTGRRRRHRSGSLTHLLACPSVLAHLATVKRPQPILIRIN
ncbi:hypothetical protein CBL_00225 [Carabus blaptoides fortunei]